MTGQPLHVIDGNKSTASHAALSPTDLPADFFLSPSLHAISRSKLPACEVKFVVTELQARQIEAILAPDFMLDPHGASEGGNRGYQTTTVYCDTPNYDTFFRIGPFRRKKYRMRRYGSADLTFLELKSKRGTCVRKQRCSVPSDQSELLSQAVEDATWAGDWFRKRVFVWSLEPVLAIRYRRTAYVGRGERGPLRLTFDRDIAGKPTESWNVEPFDDGHSILTDRVICEFKFQGIMPACFKTAIEQLQLSPTGASKYRLCLEAAGGPRRKVVQNA